MRLLLCDPIVSNACANIHVHGPCSRAMFTLVYGTHQVPDHRAQIQHLQADNARLVRLLATTAEYKRFMRWGMHASGVGCLATPLPPPPP